MATLQTDQVFPVTTVHTHMNPDADEIVALWEATYFGAHKFPGIQMAPIVFESSRDIGDTNGDELLAKEQKLCIGWGGGAFDEHAGTGTERKPGECAATLVASFLGLRDVPALAPFFNYALARDAKVANTEFEISVLAKMAFRYQKGLLGNLEEHKSATFYAIFQLFHGLYQELCRRNEGRKVPANRWVPTTDEIVARWLCRRFKLDFLKLPERKPGQSYTNAAAEHFKLIGKKEFVRIIRYGALRSKIEGIEKDNIYELSRLAKFAFEQIDSEGEARKQEESELLDSIFILLDGMYFKEYNFHVSCSKDFSNSSRYKLEGPKKRELIMCVVHSDNPEIAKYARSKDGCEAAVVVKKDTEGNVQIFTDQTRCQQASLKYVIKALRQMERLDKGIVEDLPDDVLMAEGDDVEGAWEWYYDAPHMQAFNGSLTNTKPPTLLDLRDIVKVVKKGLEQEFAEMT